MAFPQKSWEEGQRFVITEELFWLWVIKLFINVTALSFLDLGKKQKQRNEFPRSLVCVFDWDPEIQSWGPKQGTI